MIMKIEKESGWKLKSGVLAKVVKEKKCDIKV